MHATFSTFTTATVSMVRAPGVTRARIACLSVCLQAHHYCTCHHSTSPASGQAVGLYLPVPATRRPRTLLPRVQSSIRDHICCFASRLLCKPGEPELYTRPSLPCFTKMPLCHWSSDSASTNITDVQSQILNAPPLVKVLQLLSKLLNVQNPHRLQ